MGGGGREEGEREGGRGVVPCTNAFPASTAALTPTRPLCRSGSKRSDRAHLWECGETEEDDLATIAASSRSQLARVMSVDEGGSITSSDEAQAISRRMLAEINGSRSG